MQTVRRHSILLLTVAMLSSRGLADFHSPFEEAFAVQQQLRSVVETTSPSVYAVTAFTAAPADAALYAARISGTSLSKLAELRERSCGSAFAIDGSGHLLTNEHVVSGAASVWVTDDAGRVFPAIVLGTDPRTDLAVLAISSPTQPLKIDDSIPHRGDFVVALGNPDGLATDGNIAASVGCVSAAGRSLAALSSRENRSYADLIQVTTPIAVGGSGGPLIDLEGRALGLVCAVATADRDGMPVGFAIALSPTVRERIAKLERGEEIIHPYFGVSVSPVSSKAEDAAANLGARIDRVESTAPAFGILREGDVVLSIAGEAVTTDRRFVELAAHCSVDAEVRMTVRRESSLVDLFVRPEPRAVPAAPIIRATQQLTWAGATFENADGGVRVRSIDSGATMPLEVGTTLRRVNNTPTPDLAALLGVLTRDMGKPLSLDSDEASPPPFSH